VAISFIQFILGIGIIAAAIEEFKLGEKHKEPTSLIIGVSFISIMVFGGFTVLKLHYATRLNSPALHKDGFCSFIGTVLSFSLLMDTLLAVWDPTTWWLGPVISVVVGALSLGVGLRSLIRNIFFQHIPIYRLSWWMSPPPVTSDFNGASANTNGAEMTAVGGAEII
jgi:divalent metal cation (Fe/Co/Zn/Cd) transporter